MTIGTRRWVGCESGSAREKKKNALDTVEKFVDVPMAPVTLGSYGQNE